MINLTMNTKELKSYLIKLGSIAKKTSKYPTGKTVLFSSEEDDRLNLFIVSGDGVQIKIETNDRLKISFTLDFCELSSKILSLNSDIVNFTVNYNTEISIQSENLNINLKQPMDANLYAVYYVMPYIVRLEKLKCCIPKKEVKYYFNDLLLNHCKKNLTMIYPVALGVLEKTLKTDLGLTKQRSIVPKADIYTILKTCETGEDLFIDIYDVTDKASICQTIFNNKTGRYCYITIYCDLIDGERTDYKRVKQYDRFYMPPKIQKTN